MTLLKLTLSISVLAASLMLVAPAKAETWTCSYMVDLKGEKKSFSLVFVREGETIQFGYNGQHNEVSL